jgi:putative mRNA 3-end processing factor
VTVGLESNDAFSAEDVEYHEGLHLRETLLWLDAPEPRELTFISSASIPGALRHTKIVCTGQTAELLEALGSVHGRGRRVHEPQTLVTPYGRRFGIGNLSLELFPSGFALGAASLLVERGGRRLVYAGHINTRQYALAERLEARRCDVLVLPCPPGIAERLALPPEEEVERALLAFVKDAFDEQRVPILLCPLLNAAPRVAHLLSSAGVALRLHRTILAALRVHQRAQSSLDLSRMRRYRGALDVVRRPEVLLWPLSLHRSPAITRMSRARVAVVSERAQDASFRDELGVETGFALPGHADHASMIDYVRACQPESVVVVGCDETSLPRDLEGLGLQVRRVGPRRQLGLFET